VQKEIKKFIEIKGANMHNLNNLNVKIPRNLLTVVTGVSGSGKSSLIFDTLYAEGQRRYVESLSSYARQFLGKLEKPEVEEIKGLSPCIAIEQKVNTKNPRSTVATSTEIYDYLKLLFARIGRTYSPISGEEVKCHSVDDVVDFYKELANESAVYVTVKLPSDAKTLKNTLDLELKKGFSRVVNKQGVINKIEDLILDKSNNTDCYLLIDRLIKDTQDQDLESRIADSVQTAFWEGDGEMELFYSNNDSFLLKPFSNKFEADGINFELPNVNFLSFNNPYGACSTCEGFGSVIGIDEDLVVPDQSLSAYEGAVAPWRSEAMQLWLKEFIPVATMADFPIHRAYEDLSNKEKDLLWQGNKQIKGINAFFKFLEENSYKIQYRVMLSKYKGKTTCPDCYGSRLRKDASFVKLDTLNKLDPNICIDERISLPLTLLLTVEKANALFESIQFNKADSEVASRIVHEIKTRLAFLMKVGVGYLQLNRLSNSLSGGESQRINLATILGSSLVGSTYILDEPSIGLHPEDTENLIDVLLDLKAKGNTVIVVEHDEDIIRRADHLIDIGPFAGTKGGNLVFDGIFKDLIASTSITGQHLANNLIKIPSNRRKFTHSIDIKGIRIHNIKNAEIKIPLNTLCAVTGVSGSGKTSLIKGVLYPALLREIEGIGGIKNGTIKGIEGGTKQIEKIEIIDQNPIGKSSRSNPVTYIKAYDSIRDLFSNHPLSKKRGYKPSFFSFNVEGGRCDNCNGEGEEIVEMQFMADLHLTCEVCKGKRFKEEILEITHNGKSIFDVLCLTVDDAIDYFVNEETIANKLKPLQEVGLGYVTLGQSSNTLSGGEAQRVKLASYLGKGGNKEHTLFIFDEPTTGLHFHDINKLLKSFYALIKNGHSVIIIEHNLDVIKCADWIIDMGPGGGEHGGKVVFQGTPEELIMVNESKTGKHLKSKLNKS
jgi:excinuclease ABC subunit A